MKTILLSALCTLTLNVQSMEVKKDTIDKYVIDKQIIERFDGTQLEGKTISKYIIAYKNVGNMVEKNHIIITEKHGITLNGKPVKIMKYEGLIIIDGKEASVNELSHLKAEKIAKMENYKAGSKVAESYGEKAEKGVLWITTKNNKTSENIYFIDGRRAEKDEVDKLSPNKIASIKVNKKEGNSVIDVITKK